MDENEIPNEIKFALLSNEIALHKNSAWIVQIRHNVNKKLGVSAEELKSLVDEIVKHEQAIDLLKKELEAVSGRTEKPV